MNTRSLNLATEMARVVIDKGMETALKEYPCYTDDFWEFVNNIVIWSKNDDEFDSRFAKKDKKIYVAIEVEYGTSDILVVEHYISETNDYRTRGDSYIVFDEDYKIISNYGQGILKDKVIGKYIRLI